MALVSERVCNSVLRCQVYASSCVRRFNTFHAKLYKSNISLYTITIGAMSYFGLESPNLCSFLIWYQIYVFRYVRPNCKSLAVADKSTSSRSFS